MEYYSAIQKDVPLIWATTWMGLMGVMLRGKKSISKEYISYKSIYITFLEWQNYNDGEQTSDCQGSGKSLGVAIKG